ncbi:MAG: PAS domain S-box protein [Ignavibacteriae bacterium]|nr:PAS domain S-box protein [Ignavibacteriota bacterium]
MAEIHDITKTELLLNARKYKGIIESLNGFIVRTDNHGKFTYVNESFCKISGKNSSELIGKSFMPFVHTDDLPRTLYAMKGLGHPPYRITNERREMTTLGWRWIHWEQYAISDDNGITNEIQAVGRDITEFKNLIHSAGETNEIFGAVLKSSPFAIVVIGLNGLIRFWSRGAEKIFGWQEDEVIGKPNPLGSETDYSPEMTKKEIYIKEETFRITYITQKRKDGSIVNLESTVTTLYDTNGEVNGSLNIYKDITSERMTKAENVKLSHAVLQNPVGIAFFDAKGFLESANKVFTDIAGYTQQEIKGMSLYSLKPSGLSEDDYSELWNTISSGKEWKRELLKQDGEVYRENVIIFPVDNGGGEIVNYLFMREDISEKKKTLAELINVKFQLGAIMNNLSNMVIYESGGSADFISGNIKSLLGYSSEEFMSENDFIRNLIHSDDIADYILRYDKWIHSDNENILKLEFRCRRRNGTYVWVENYVSRASKNDTNYVNGLLVDINERKENEQKIKYSESLLRLLSQNAGFGFYVVDYEKDKVVYINEKFCDFWNLREYYDKIKSGFINRAEIIKLCSLLVEEPESFISMQSNLADIRNTITFEDEIRLINGTTIRRYSSILKDEANRYIGRFFLNEDITQKKIFESVEKSKNDYQVIIDEAVDAIFLADMRGYLVNLNVKAENLLGYPREELVGLHIREVIDESDLSENPLTLEELTEGKTVLSKRTLKKKDGTLINVEVKEKKLPINLIQAIIRETSGRSNISNTPDAEKNRIYLNLFVKLKAFKHGENSLMVLNRLSLYAKNYKQLRTYKTGNVEVNLQEHIPIRINKETLERFRQLIAEFNIIVHPQHEYIAAMLNIIAFEIPKISVFDKISNFKNELSENSESLINEAGKLYDSVLNDTEENELSKISDSIVKHVVRVKDIIKSVTEILEDNFTADIKLIIRTLAEKFSVMEKHSENRIRISFTDVSGAGRAIINGNEFAELINILFENSIEAFNSAEPITADKSINISLSSDGEKIRVAFADNGPGIPDSIKDSLFRIGVSTKGGNRGFGLNYAAKIVNKFGGLLSYDTENITGAKFIIELNIY